MNCKKCGSPLENNNKFCGICGTPVEQNTSQNIQNNISVQPVADINQEIGIQQSHYQQEPIQNVEKEGAQTIPNRIEELAQPEPIQKLEESDFKEKKHPIIPIILIVVLLGVVAYFLYTMLFKKSDKIVENLINNTYEKLEQSIEKTNIVTATEPVLVTTEISGNTNIPGLEDLNGLKLKLITGLDSKNKKLEVNASLLEDNKEVIEAGMYFLNNYAYAILKDIYETPLKLSDKELDLDELLNNSNISQEDLKFILKEYKNILIKSLNMNDFKESSDTIVLNGKETKVTKTSYILDNEKATTLVNNIVDNTLKNEKLLETLAKMSDIEVELLKQSLNESKITVEDKILEDHMITFNIYTKGIKNDFAGLDIKLPNNSIIEIRKENKTTTVSANLSGVSIMLNIKEENENKCSVDYKIAIATQEIKGTINVENKKINAKTEESTMTFSITYQEQTANFTINMKQEKEASIANINVSNAKLIEELTEQEMSQIEQKLMEKLMSSKLYNFIETQMKNTLNAIEEKDSFNYDYDLNGIDYDYDLNNFDYSQFKNL